MSGRGDNETTVDTLSIEDFLAGGGAELVVRYSSTGVEGDGAASFTRKGLFVCGVGTSGAPSCSDPIVVFESTSKDGKKLSDWSIALEVNADTLQRSPTAGSPPEDATGALRIDAELSLWHPLGRPAAQVAEWRRFLASLDVTQPFKQVDRELYLVEEEKPNARESARFAGRTVRQHQLAALLRERGWTYSLMGAFDSANTPTKQIQAYDLHIALEVDAPEDAQTSDAGIYVEVVTGGVRFLRNGRALKLRDVPARCFSEVMRDVDLFVSSRRETGSRESPATR